MMTQQPPPTPDRWTPTLVAVLLVRLIGAACIVFGLFAVFDWIAYRVEYNGVPNAQRDIYFAAYAGKYLLAGGLLLLLEPTFARWLLGGRLSEK
jgi:hypothetical protein